MTANSGNKLDPDYAIEGGWLGVSKRGPDREVVGGLLVARLASPTHIPRITLIEIVQRIVKNQATQMSESSKRYVSTPAISISRIRYLDYGLWMPDYINRERYVRDEFVFAVVGISSQFSRPVFSPPARAVRQRWQWLGLD